MKSLLYGILCILLTVGAASADDLKIATDRIQTISDRIAKLSSGKVADYARSQLNTAQATLGAAKAALAIPNGTLALQRTELAMIQLDHAEATAAEKEGAEQLLLRRAELRKLEAQFDQHLQTGGK